MDLQLGATAFPEIIRIALRIVSRLTFALPSLSNRRFTASSLFSRGYSHQAGLAVQKSQRGCRCEQAVVGRNIEMVCHGLLPSWPEAMGP